VGFGKLNQLHGNTLPDKIVPQRRRWLHQQIPFVQLEDRALLFGQVLEFFEFKFRGGTHTSDFLLLKAGSA
jgi:hypothetical protein